MPKDKKYFRDPIHGFIEVSGCALRIVDCPYFQRLRRIKQVAFTNYAYHGAEHSRFGHSLGAYHLARLLSERLLPSDENDIKEEFCLAALLHDIGHHPFSHSFESVLVGNQDTNIINYEHENYTEAIIRNTIVGEYIEDSGLNETNVINLINGRYLEKVELSYLNDLISSELDVDRLDYLPRDAFYCGVPYGRLDLDRISLSLEPKDGEIIVGAKGRESVEMYILARFFMYTQVYLHHTTRAFDIMLKNVFLKDFLNNLNYPKPVKADIERIVGFDDFWLRRQLLHLSQHGSSLGKTLSANILNRNPLKVVMQKKAFADAQTSAIDPDYAKIVNLENDIEDIARRAGIETEKIYFDTPWKDLPFENRYRPYSSSEDRNVIKVRLRGKISDIAMDPTSLCFYLAKCIAQTIRIYTLDEHREDVAKAISDKYSDLVQYIWPPE
jgi:HD superfamily phosphohydrolase